MPRRPEGHGSVLVAEDLLLCLTDDRTGGLVVSGSTVDVGLGGALLVELALRGRVAVAAAGERIRRGHLVVRDPTPTADPVLDDALAAVRAKEGRKPQHVVGGLGKGRRAQLYERLAAAGAVRREERRVLGLFPGRRWPAADVDRARGLRDRLAVALQRGATDDARVAALVSLLAALDALHRVVVPAQVGLTRRELQERAKQIAAGEWAGKAVRDAIAGMNAAVTAAITVTIATGAGGS